MLWGETSRGEIVTPLAVLTSNRLNLTVASRVYLMEPQWNPSIEDQAMARVYRLGQTREVTTVRYVMDQSIEKVSRDEKQSARDLAKDCFSTCSTFKTTRRT